MPHQNGLTVAMGGRTIDIETISEKKVVEERVVIVGDAVRKCFELSILIGSKRILRKGSVLSFQY
jgi:hypothetical protein